MTIRIEMKPAEQYRTENYGVLLESVTLHDMNGRIHNPHFPHRIEIWENRYSVARGEVIDPHGEPTRKRYSFLTNPQAVVITSHPGKPDQYGPTLTLGDTVILHVNGFDIGTYTICAKPLNNPHLESVEVAQEVTS